MSRAKLIALTIIGLALVVGTIVYGVFRLYA
jgi:hypothetical protein